MSIDLSKLTPAKWHYNVTRGVITRSGDGLILFHKPTWVWDADLEFIALARNALAGDPDALVWWEMNRVRPAEQEKAK